MLFNKEQFSVLIYRNKVVDEYLLAIKNKELYCDNVRKDTADIRIRDYWKCSDNDLYSS